MIFPNATNDEYTEIGSSGGGWADALCRYRLDVMSGSMGMFQISTFLLNIESFLTNICLSIYFCFYCTCMETDFGWQFVKSAGHMSVCGVVVVVFVVGMFRFFPAAYYYYWFRIGTNMACTAICVLMTHYWDQVTLYWFTLPVIMTLMVLLDVSTHLLLSTNTPHGCIAFIFGSNQVFQLTAFIVGPLLMGLFCDFAATDNTLTYWSITSAILSIQLLVTLLISSIQALVLCCCTKEKDKEANSNRKYIEEANDPTDMENE